MTPTVPKSTATVGIMADSHGQVAMIDKALLLFKKYRCETIFHLGDICDSVHPETADRCVSLLRENNVFGIKGNNDHQVVVNHEGRQQARLTSTTIEYLKQLPLTIERGDILMTHSLPFVKERGLSSMVGALGPGEAELFFRTYSHKVLFRGHSHFPEILRQRRHTFETSKMLPGDTIQVSAMKSCIITCGALDQGFLMIWKPGRRTITCHTVN